MKFPTMSLKTAVTAACAAAAVTSVLVLIGGGADIDAVLDAVHARKAKTTQSTKTRTATGTRVFTRTTSEGLVAQPAARPAAPPAPRPIPTPTPQNNGNGNSSGEGPGQGGGIATGTFQIGGQVAGLYPGAARPMVVTFTNPAAIAIRVTQLDVIAASSNHIGCTAQDLLMPDSAVDVVVPAGSSTTHTVYVGMIDDADNACQGASWALSFSGTAVQA